VNINDILFSAEEDIELNTSLCDSTLMSLPELKVFKYENIEVKNELFKEAKGISANGTSPNITPPDQ
jgi:hypothetical protein